MSYAFAVRRWARIGLGALGATVAVASPALANDMSGIVYPLFIWPVGALLVVVQLVMIIWSLLAKRPARHLGLWTIIITAFAGLAYPPYVFALGIERMADLNAMTAAPVVLLAMVGVVVGRKLRREKPPELPAG